QLLKNLRVFCLFLFPPPPAVRELRKGTFYIKESWWEKMPDFQNIRGQIYCYTMGTRNGKQKHSQNVINTTNKI
uniref:Uncharacterized protein n=1 Tax=Pavo cristatus TaxID=9049 RepID=A0A8C9EZR9_PAVCR